MNLLARNKDYIASPKHIITVVDKVIANPVFKKIKLVVFVIMPSCITAYGILRIIVIKVLTAYFFAEIHSDHLTCFIIQQNIKKIKIL